MKQTQPISYSLPADIRPALCRIVPLKRVPGEKRSELAVCSLPEGDSPEQLAAAFKAAPQFNRISVEKILKHKGGLRIILMGENDYYLRQAAVYMAAMCRKQRDTASDTPEDDFWNDFELDESLRGDAADSSFSMENSLAVVAPSLLDPALARDSAAAARPNAAMQMIQEQKQIALGNLSSAAVLIAAESGKVLSETVVEKIGEFLEGNDPQHIFVALNPNRADLELVEELRFVHGFGVCRVGQADADYLQKLLAQTAADIGIKLAADADLGKAIALLRRYRGSAFSESDFEPLLKIASERKGKRALLDTDDLLVKPYRDKKGCGREALQAMVGLNGVKESVNRLLAAAALEDRRRMNGAEIPPSCRNLAFSGRPGTGKSVTARLAAQILREEGCGSGRFVEVGREQLIGAYLGHTSPMIADLFKQAKGGVLFIDEAGALLDNDGHDSYSTEAVNALVRHMELEPETMVIFATYPEEMDRFLASNPGLSSRVAQVIHFPDYNKDELFDIFGQFAQKEQLTLPEDAAHICSSFFERLQRCKGKDFGNGREARRLFQAAKEEMALRAVTDPEVDSALSADDLKRAAQRLLEQEVKRAPAVQHIGFAV